MNRTNMDLWAEVLEKLPGSYRSWFSKEREYLRNSISSGSKVLEVGCGDGRSISDIIPKTQNIVGVDIEDWSIADAKKNFSIYPTIKFLKADAKSLPFADASFDFVICMTTFANFGEDKYKVLNEMKRVLKDSGEIIISVFAENAFEERMKVYKAVNVKIKDITGGTFIFEEGDGETIVSEQFSKKELEEIFDQVSLKVKDITKAEIAYLCKLQK